MMIVMHCTPDGEVARFPVDACILQLVYQGDVKRECIEPHPTNAGQILGLFGVVLFMDVAVHPSELPAPAKAPIILLARALVVALVRSVRPEPNAHCPHRSDRIPQANVAG